MVLEICVDSVESALAAARGGAERLELCSDIAAGGISPSAGLIEYVRQRVRLDLSVLLRPRPGDFVYSDDEFEVLQSDIIQAKKLGANSVVIGLLDVYGDVDLERTRELVELARPLKVAFHRAFDMTRDLFASLDVLIAAGVDRVLTSGGKLRAVDGAGVIRLLQEKAQDEIVIMPGGGITAANLLEIASRTGATEFHAGLKTRVPSRMQYQKAPIFLGEGSEEDDVRQQEYSRFVVLEEDVRGLRKQLAQLEMQHQS